MSLKSCSVQNCSGYKYKAKGLCTFHYDRSLKGVPLDARKRTKASGRQCSVDGCENGVVARGWCAKHFQKWRKYGDPKTTKISVEYGDGKEWRVNKLGYVFRYDHELRKADPNKRGLVYQHRVVMENHLSRALLPTESVHHINGNRSDNRIENLELWVTFQPSGQRPQDLVAYAREILDRYGKDYR